MVTATLVVRNDALAWGQRLDTLLPATPAPRQRAVPAHAASLPAAASVITVTPAEASGLPAMSQPITGVVVMPASPVPVQTAPPPPIAAAAAVPTPVPQETGWMRGLQSWILGVARSIGQ